MDTLITNCQLYRPFHPASNKLFQIRIKADKIVAIEENGYRQSKSKIFNAKGRPVSASFKDSHIHLLRYSLMKKERDLRNVNTWQHLREELHDRKEMEAFRENDWIIGRGLHDNRFKDRDSLLTAKDLDLLDLDAPVFILHQDGHECVLNSKALEIVKKKKDLEKSHDKFIEKDENGNWTGRFKDTAVHFIKMHFRSKSEDEARDALADSFSHLAEYGLTHVDSDDLNYVGSYQKVWNAYTDLDKNNGLPFGAYLHHYVFTIDDMKNFIKNYDLRTGQGEGNVRVGAFKIFIDGTYRLHTAALNLPYEDTGEAGALIYEQEELNKMLKLAEENQMQVAMHCIGDRAVETAATAIALANKKERNPLRHRIIHMQNTRLDLLKFLAIHKIPVETQPGFIPKEWKNYRTWLGREREQLAMVAQRMLDEGVLFSSSSDAPIGPLNPMEHIHAAVNRTDSEGQPEGGWQPQEKITIDAAFNSYTATPAWINHSDELTGKLLPGYQADLMVLDQHPHEISPDELDQMRVDALWYRGKMVFDRYD